MMQILWFLISAFCKILLELLHFQRSSFPIWCWRDFSDCWARKETSYSSWAAAQTQCLCPWLHAWLHSPGGRQARGAEWPEVTRERRQTEKQALTATDITQSHFQATAVAGGTESKEKKKGATKQERRELRAANQKMREERKKGRKA